MPPRIPIPSRLGGYNLCFRPAPKPSNRPLPITYTANVSTFAQRKANKDPYALAQSAQRKAANQARQAVLREERQKASGDPVRGILTPFVESFDDVSGSAVFLNKTNAEGNPIGVELKTGDDVFLNHFVSPTELKQSIDHSFALTKPETTSLTQYTDPWEEENKKKIHEESHARATTAISRIVNLANACQKDKTRVNIKRCIDTFGRHNTDRFIRRRPWVNREIYPRATLRRKTPRAGPDTGSSEVQIAILTAKIRVLANELEKKGRQNDKINKRNLRVMVHKRQKLLAYLRTKERGSGRWENVISTLGLTEGTWKGEISL